MPGTSTFCEHFGWVNQGMMHHAPTTSVLRFMLWDGMYRVLMNDGRTAVRPYDIGTPAYVVKSCQKSRWMRLNFDTWLPFADA